MTIDTESNDFLPLIDAYSSTSADLKLPYISTNYRKNSKSAYHYEWHVDPAPDYYQAPGTKNYGINCGAVSAAMLVAFYDSSSLTYSSLLPSDFALKYEDDVEQIQGLIDDLSVRFEIEKYNTGYSGLMVKGLIDFFDEKGYSIQANYQKNNAFQLLKDITYESNVCIVHTEDHWSLGIGYYTVNGDGEYGIVHTGWEEDRGNYFFKKDKIDGVLYISED